MWAKLFSSLSVEGSFLLKIPGIVEKTSLMQNDNDKHGRDGKRLMLLQ